MSQLLRFIRAAVPGAGTDRDLLDRFTRDRDEEAFALLVRRYGAVVWRACQRLAGPDAEDAFQAVFLTLARKAHSVRGSLPAWLHEVARRVAANLRRAARRRTAVEAAGAHRAVTGPDDLTLREGLAALDEELARLPERYRAVLIVCCLEGRSRDEAAAQLGWSEGQVKGRLERAREMLRSRLARRGIELGGVLLAATLPGSAPAAPVVPSAALLTAGHVSPAVLSLTNGVIHAMLVQKLTIAATVLLVTAVAGAVTYRTAPGGTETAGGVPAPVAPTAPAPGTPEQPVKTPPDRWEKLLQDKKLTAKQRAAYEQIAKLRTVKAPETGFGSVQIPSFIKDSTLPTDVLYAMGLDALPMLAEALDDETPTATVIVLREGALKHEKVWKVNELVALLVVRIADRDFVTDREQEPKFPSALRSLNLLGIRDLNAQPGTAADFKKAVIDWHAANRDKTPAERKIADVTDVWFRNRFDAVIWLGQTKAKEGRKPIAGRVDAFYADPKRSVDSTTRSEMSYCALALGQIGDKAGLPQVRTVCEDLSYWVETYGVGDSGMIEDLFRAYQGLALLGEKEAAVKELERLVAAFGEKFEAGTKKEYGEKLKAAKGW